MRSYRRQTIFETKVLEVLWKPVAHKLAMPCSACPSQWLVVLEELDESKQGSALGRAAVTVPNVTDRLVDVKGPPRAVV